MWIFGCRSKSVRAGLDRGLDCTPVLSVTQQRRCSCGCWVWRYISVMMPLYPSTDNNNPYSQTFVPSPHTIPLRLNQQELTIRGRFRFLAPPAGTICLSTSHLRRHSRFSDNDSRPFCFPVHTKTQDSCATINNHHYCLGTPAVRPCNN